MPIFALIQALVARVVVGVVVVLTALGLGSISDSPTHISIQQDPAEEVVELEVPIEEISTIPEGTPVLPEKERDKTVGTLEADDFSEEITPEGNPVEVPPRTEKVVMPTPPSDEVENVVDPINPSIETPLSFSQINTDTAEALINILCSQNVAGAVNSITGSGVIIDPRGVVITNAHVAQFFLLKDYPVENSLECVLRTGSPARSTYTAELLYISPEWVNLHAVEITDSEPKGTGEHDYAFLRITGRTDPNAKLPTTFPFIPIDINSRDIHTGNHVLVAAYPAGFLGSISVQRDLYSVSSVTTVGERFTFVDNTIDVLSLGGTVVSQGGSSGGAVVSDKNELIGIIVTSTKADTTSERDLRAITLGYINRALAENSNNTVEGLLFGDVMLKAKLFNLGIAPILTDLFLTHLLK